MQIDAGREPLKKLRNCVKAKEQLAQFVMLPTASIQQVDSHEEDIAKSNKHTFYER